MTYYNLWYYICKKMYSKKELKFINFADDTAPLPLQIIFDN